MLSGSFDRRNKMSNLKNGLDMLYIYQIKDGMRDYAFVSMSSLKRRGLEFSIDNYNLVYAEEWTGEGLDAIWKRFNINRPEGFRGHSLSVSDVIGIRHNGIERGYFVDSVGFTPISMQTVAETEAAVKVGEFYISIHQCDEGWDFDILDLTYRLVDGGVIDNPEITLREALMDIVEDLFDEIPVLEEVSFEEVAERAERINKV